MLVLTRKRGEQIRLGDDVVITVLRVKGQSVRIGIEAPKELRVIRAELNQPVDETPASAAASAPDRKRRDVRDPGLRQLGEARNSPRGDVGSSNRLDPGCSESTKRPLESRLHGLRRGATLTTSLNRINL